MIRYIIILINKNNPPPKFGTVEFLYAVLRFFNSLIIQAGFTYRLLVKRETKLGIS